MPAVEHDDGASTSTVQLAKMPSQMEVRTREDDWTGITSTAERRRLQNRLNQRIYRRRRRAKPGMPSPDSKPDRGPETVVSRGEIPLLGKFKGLVSSVGDVVELQDQTDWSPKMAFCRSNLQIAMRRSSTGRGSDLISQAQLGEMMAQFEERARKDYMLGSPRVDQLLTLIQFNVFRALLSNTLTLGWSFEWLECDDPISPWNTTSTREIPLCPQALLPTYTQKQIQHHPWIDLWPMPKMRDNLLLAGDSYDEDQLCNDLVEFSDIPNEQTGLIVWSEPWNPRGWEVSETFIRNWGWAVKGCVELLESTNYWREKRGENPLVF